MKDIRVRCLGSAICHKQRIEAKRVSKLMQSSENKVCAVSGAVGVVPIVKATCKTFEEDKGEIFSIRMRVSMILPLQVSTSRRLLKVIVMSSKLGNSSKRACLL